VIIDYQLGLLCYPLVKKGWSRLFGLVPQVWHSHGCVTLRQIAPWWANSGWRAPCGPCTVVYLCNSQTFSAYICQQTFLCMNINKLKNSRSLLSVTFAPGLVTSCKAGGRHDMPPPLSSPRGRRSASRGRADSNLAAVSHGQHVPTPTAAAAWRANTAVSKAAWWPWPWKWCPSHVWRGLPLCKLWSS